MINTRINKAVIINGLARGGTNILWNILQSHPNIVSPMLETSELIGNRSKNKYYFKLIHWCYNKNLLQNYCINTIKKELLKEKINTLKDEYNCFKTITEKYQLNEVLNATLCLKGVCNNTEWDIDYNNIISETVDKPYYLFLIKNGYSVCESWTRRGITAKKAGLIYSRYCETIINKSEKLDNCKIIKFEDILVDPFKEATKIFNFIEEHPYELDHIRLKLKKTIKKNGDHNCLIGEIGTKKWLNKETIFDVLNPDINKIHISKVKLKDIKDFESSSQSVLNYFDYSNPLANKVS